MSEPDDIFGFKEVEDDGLDIEAIFGGRDAGISTPLPPLDVPQPAETGKTLAPSETTNTAPDASSSEALVKTPSEKEPDAEPDLFAAFSETGTEAAPTPEREQAAAKPESEKQMSLFDKPAVFKYGSAKDPIKDASMTFEELRIQKSDDFPELSEGKKVSWIVKYGDITKSVADPQNTTIAKIKEEIEKSKSFLDALKKGKLKDPECYVSPQVRAGSKGIAAYKGVFPTVEAARKSGKIINLIPSSDGKIYELRKTELGEFVAPTTRIADFSEVRAGFKPALPLIPREVMGQLISFFRSFMDRRGEFEALAFIYWDRHEEEFVLHIPKQSASKAYIGYRMEEDALPEDRYLHYADIHSHNSMAAKFSAVDDADERATRLYLVVGRLDRFYPEITARVSCGGTFLEIDPGEVIEGIGEEFPAEWLDRVERSEPYQEGRKGSEENPLESRCLKVILG